MKPGTPNQNASIESVNGRFRDECLNEHGFTTLAHAQALIEAWRCAYNEERPTKGVGGLTPALYAKQLAAERSTVTPGLSSRPLLKAGGRRGQKLPNAQLIKLPLVTLKAHQGNCAEDEEEFKSLPAGFLDLIGLTTKTKTL